MMAIEDSEVAQKIADTYNFVKADEFFANVDSTGSGYQRPSSISYDPADQLNKDGSPNPVCRHGRVFRFVDGSLLLIQFVRPQIWRLRFESKNRAGSDFSDYNSRTIVQDTLSRLIDVLDKFERISWKVELVEDPDYIVLQSVKFCKSQPCARNVVTQLFIQRKPFKITAVQQVKLMDGIEKVPQLSDPDSLENGLSRPDSARRTIVWQTKENGLAYLGSATVLGVEKPGMARYLGFGGQGGKSLLKDRTFLNYFNYDNMMYNGVYGVGPMDGREPLYHSEPFWLEVNAHPNYQSKVATFVDNYSQICVDFGKTNGGAVRVGTRYGSLQYYVVAGKDIPEIIKLYTSIIGRPRLKPRYALGFHQGCYGYDTKEKLLEIVKRYRAEKFPLDGLHIDVDIQDEYRTFTIDDKGRFPDPADMFKQLKDQGVKSCTNITPFINSTPTPSYPTLNDGLSKGYFVKDKRYLDGLPSKSHHDQRYICYEAGKPVVINPNTQRPDYGDDYDFKAFFNNEDQNYHGGVSYGGELGRPGVYPDLNKPEVRRWWGRQYEYLFNTGIDFVWQDMTSPCVAKEYGDMKGFPFRLLLSSDGWSGDPATASEKPAIEIWSLYSYNLHKATYHGLNRLAKRRGKRNFIIGRGSFAGLHRYAGLWTGDNASTWPFLKISVAQVLSLGLSGVSIAGADVGGFMPNQNELYADPELLIRWYCAYSLLPWFRNHYHGKPGMKIFQEPFRYPEYFAAHADEIGWDQKWLYDAVREVCLYYMRLRYSLLQLLYDAMFENMITGLPIARALIITDTLDTSLHTENDCILEDEYMVRNDLLVAPILERQQDKHGQREVYLPRPDNWYTFNLRIDGSLGAPLQRVHSGGTFVHFDAHISSEPTHIPYVTPMFVREGGIIPQIEARDYIPDRTSKHEDPNPLSIHIYPGKDNSYDIFLDDGVSRESAPDVFSLRSNPIDDDETNEYLLGDAFGDPEARGVYRKVHICQTTERDTIKGMVTRRVAIKTLHDGYGPENVARDIGSQYKVVLWHEKKREMKSSVVTIFGGTGASYRHDNAAVATVVSVPVEADDVSVGVIIELQHRFYEEH